MTDPAREASAVSAALGRPLLEKEAACWPVPPVPTEPAEAPEEMLVGLSNTW